MSKNKSWMILVLFAIFMTTNVFGLDTVIFNSNCEKAVLTLTGTERVSIEQLKFIPCRQISFDTYDCDCPQIRLSYLPPSNESSDFQFRTNIDYLENNQVKNIAQVVSVIGETAIIEPGTLPIGWVSKVNSVVIPTPAQPEPGTQPSVVKEKVDYFAWVVPIKAWFSTLKFEWKKEYTYALILLVVILFFILKKRKNKGNGALPVPAIPEIPKRRSVVQPTQPTAQVPNQNEAYVPVGAKSVKKKVSWGKNGFKLEKEYEVTWEKVKE